MPGLLDMLQTASQDPATSQGILRFGLSLLQSKGNLGGAIGQAGMQGLQGAQDYRQQQFQRQIQQSQLDQIKRQKEMQNLPGQFATPAQKLPTQDNADVGQPGEPPVTPAGFDFSGYVNALMGKDPTQAIDLQQKLAKPTSEFGQTPHYDQSGNAFVLDKAGRPRFLDGIKAQPDAGKTSPLGQLYSEMNALPAGDPRRKAYQDAITKASTHQPATSVSVGYGAPVAGVDAQGNPVYFQPSKDGKTPPSIISGVAPPKREVPASTAMKIAENAVVLDKIDRAIGLVDANPNSLGMQNILGDTITQRTDPKGVETRAMVADLGGQKIHDRSGASVTVSEAPRLTPFVPSANDNAATVKKKLVLFRKEYTAMQQALQSGASVVQATAKPASSGFTYLGKE